jgi:hypothetical protein
MIVCVVLLPSGEVAWGVDASRQARAERVDNRLMMQVGLGR